MTLEKLLRRRHDVEVGLVSKENYLVLPTGPARGDLRLIGIVDTITPIRRLCPRTNLYTREDGVRRPRAPRGHDRLRLQPAPLPLEYDHLVVALGNLTSFAGQPGLEEHALPFKYLGDALALRNHVIHAMEEADIEAAASCAGRC